MDPGPGRGGRPALRLNAPAAGPVAGEDRRTGEDRPTGEGPEDGGGPGPGRIPRLHAVVPDAVAARDGFEASAAAMWDRAGAELALHLRLREATARRLHGLARRLSERAAAAGGWCVVNGRVDVALAAGAQGVQLGSGSLPADEARRVLGPGTAVGVSAHAPPEARDAGRAGANLVLLGTIFPTPSHPDRPGAGLARVAACRDAGPPVIAIGGMTPARAAVALGAGAHGVAAVRGVWEADDPAAAAGRYLEAMRATPEGGR